MKYFRILILNTLIVNFQQETIAFRRKKIQSIYWEVFPSKIYSARDS